VKDARRILRQVLVLGGLSIIVAAAVNFPLIKRLARGEFRETFFQAADFPGIRLITLQEAEDLWSGGKAFVLDARAAEFFGRGHVPGARNLSAAGSGIEIPADVLGLARSGTLVVYCEGGDCRSSLALAKLLHEAGFLDIRVFSGGWGEWQAAGLPEEKGDDQE